jgi:hypothetical protein
MVLRPKVKSPAKPEYGLRVVPDKSWIERVAKYVGRIKIPYILGAGITAVKIADDRKEV